MRKTFTLFISFLFLCLYGGSAQAHQVKAVPVVESLSHPWSVVFLSSDEYLITEREGHLLYFDGQGNKHPISGLPEIYNQGQGGLLDVVLAPDFESSGLIYFSFSSADAQGKANTELAKARLNLDNKTLEEVQIIFKALPKVAGSNHFGSRLLFDSEGYLYMTLGERFDYKKQAQDPSNHLGTIVRLNSDGSIPADNPFVGNDDGDDAVYAYGVRNAQGIALHPVTQNILFHEHGPMGGDEINILKAAANYGWPKVTYGLAYSGAVISKKTTAPGITDPLLHWTPSIAPSGMDFYTGDDFPTWKNNVFIGALAGRHLRRVILDGKKVMGQEILLEDFGKRIRDVVMAPDGYLYILTDEADGGLYRIEENQEHGAGDRT